jgi:calcium/calmodulin-dependent protein kinase I
VTDFNVSKFSDSYKEFGDLKHMEKIEMWTYTGTVSFSAPEIFTGEGYKYLIL